LVVSSYPGRRLPGSTLANSSRWPKIPHKHIEETEANIAGKIFRTPDASGAIGRQFHFAIIDAKDPTQKVIGIVGINSLAPAPSIGYGLHPGCWGMGYASEAVTGLINAWWKLNRIDPAQLRLASEKERLFAACNRENFGSMKVLQKNGFKVYREVYLDGDTLALLVLERPQS
jgi:RimJ/RimL family protein N-acetyltransferase